MIINYPKNSLILVILLLFFAIQGYSQLVVSGISEDPYRSIKTDHKPTFSTNTAKTSSTQAASTYSDTLRLPFFEDFSGRVVAIDSIVISSLDNLVKIYDATLRAYPTSTKIFIGFEKSGLNALETALSTKPYYSNKNFSPYVVLSDTPSLSVPIQITSTDVVIKDAYWRLASNPYTTELDTLKWLTKGNTYINNRFPSNPVSYNVATFDGLKEDGTPYSTVNVFAKGFTDNLTSLPINLKGFGTPDNIYLSYYWQQNGIGDVPETEDYLVLEFKDSTKQWNVVQTISGNISYMKTFKIEMVPVNDSIYYFKDFQFRFRTYGRQSGPYDIWNLDYIYLNSNRSVIDTTFNDKTIGYVQASFLKNYTALPYAHFFTAPVFLSGKMIFTDNNLDQNVTDNQFFQVVNDYYISTPTKTLFSTCLAKDHFPASDPSRTFQDTCQPDVSSLTQPTVPFYIDQRFSISASDTFNILKAFNNVYNNISIFWDYYAYDDGSPEWGVGANQYGTKFANKYTLITKDTLTHIDIYFTRSKGPNLSGSEILLSVWDENKKLISQQTIQILYGGYIRYKLKTPIILTTGKDFYVGYQQNFSSLLSVGYDSNADNSDKVFYSTSGNNWQQFNLQPGYVKGTLMIRPVFSKKQTLITPIVDKEDSEEEVYLFPIPADQTINLVGKISSVQILDLSGRQMLQKQFNPYEDEKNIVTSDLQEGLYIALLKVGDKTIVKKIMILR